MAITATHYELFRKLPLPRGGSLLEIGEANWYGDLDPRQIAQDYPEAADVVEAAMASFSLYAIAKALYAATFAPERLVAVDMHGTPAALRLDLNGPIELPGTFDVVINHGTAEHIFNIGQVFRTMHDACAVGGLMVHDAPFTGWIDHGFYCLQPTLFYDLAAANNYEVVRVAAHQMKTREIVPIYGRDDVHRREFPHNSMLFVALRKICDRAFRVPMQGYYARALSAEGMNAWNEKR